MDNTSVNASTPNGTTGDVDYKALYEATEKRRKDAQSSLTPVQQENARLQAELAILKTTPQALPVEEQTRLDDLMYTDPAAWRIEMNRVEEAQKQKYEEIVETKKAEIISEMTQEQVVEKTRAFFATRPEIDPKVIIDSMPKKLQTMLDNGEIGLEEYLQKGIDLVNGATIASVLAPTVPNLSSVAGSKQPSDRAKKAESDASWADALI